ncbi:MAG: hypothetical protein NTX86_02765 [Candidatus Dependentiae bacterium]|nr:hypothetical protein [Candidatus Dependentiae bacterium]
MITSLHELKNEQDAIRLQLFELYKLRSKSILKTSKDINIPYTSLRSFMLGKKLHSLNLLKIKDWLQGVKEI